MTEAKSPTRHWVVASAAAATLLLVVSLAGRGSNGGASCRGALIPAYVPPRELHELLARPELPRMLVINPANGPGGERQRAYRDAVRRAQRAGVRVLGYVPTGYASRPAADVRRDIDRYRSWYGVDGAFLDEAAAGDADVPYYRDLARHAREGRGRLVILNPGTVPARAYFDLADVVVTFEGPYDAYAGALERMPEWTGELAPERIAHLIYGADRDQALAAVRSAAGAGYVYATSGVQPNPWRTIPSSSEHAKELTALCD